MKKKWTKKAEPMPCLFFLLHSKLLIELINSTLSGSSLLVSGVERMALGTDFHVNLRLCWTCHEGVSTVAGYGCLIVAWMNSFSHNSLFLHGFQPYAFVYPKSDYLVFIKLNRFSQNTIPQKRKRRKSCFPILFPKTVFFSWLLSSYFFCEKISSCFRLS